MFNTNIILATDSYKTSQFNQYPPGTEYVYSYIESRGGTWDDLVFLGAQVLIRNVLTRRVTNIDVVEARAFLTAHGQPFNEEGWNYIVEERGGYLPVEIKTLPEGAIVNGKTVLLTIVNTDPKCAFLVSYLETMLLRAIWYPTTVATLSFQMKKIIAEAIERSSDDPTQLPFKLHDFGARGVSSAEASELGGMAHLVNFSGTDTLEGVLGAMRFYDAGVCGFSIPASEHSTITSWGGPAGEVDAYRNMIQTYGKPGSLFSVVSDSYDIYNAVENLWGGELRDELIASGGTLVVRPDSGDVHTVPVRVAMLLDKKFGSTVNSKGFKVLNGVRIIQGDGIDAKSLPSLINNLLAKGFAIDNMAFGMGGGLLQKVDRDTLKFAMKCSAICVNGEWRDVYKDPITDQGKRSKRGRFKVVMKEDRYVTVPLDAGGLDRLIPVFRDGKIICQWHFDNVRARANAPFENLGQRQLEAAE